MQQSNEERIEISGIKTGFYDPLTKKSNFLRWSHSQFVRAMADKLPADVLVLDLGCGRGDYRPLFHRQRYVGADVSPSFSELDCIADVNHLPFIDQSIDVVLANNLLEHVVTPHLVLDEIRRVLKPDRKIYVLVPFLIGIHQEPVDFFRYTKYGLKYLLYQAGFTELSLQAVGGLFALEGHLLPGIVRRIFDLLKNKRGGTLAVRFLYPAWKIFYYRALLPLLHKLDRLDDHDDFTLGYVGVFQKAGHPDPSVDQAYSQASEKVVEPVY